MTGRQVVYPLLLLATAGILWYSLRPSSDEELSSALRHSTAGVAIAKQVLDTTRKTSQVVQERARRVQTESRTVRVTDTNSVKTALSNLDTAVTDLQVRITVEREASDSVIFKLSRLQDSTVTYVHDVRAQERKRTLVAILTTAGGAVIGAAVGTPLEAAPLGAAVGAVLGAILGLVRH